MNTLLRCVLTFVVVTSNLLIAPATPSAHGREDVLIPGLEQPVFVVRDSDGVVHVYAMTMHDMAEAQGWVHARDRLFQMDLTRRQASGTLAELLGPGALAGDVEARTIGLHRAARRSLGALTPLTRDLLSAYSDGVKAYATTHALPPEYAALELSRFEPWAPEDSVVVGKAVSFALSFDTDDLVNTQALQAYVETGASAGFDGQKLFSEDLFRSAPFDPISVVEGAEQPPALTAARQEESFAAATASASAIGQTAPVEPLVRAYLARARSFPLLRGALLPDREYGGSNAWTIAGRLTETKGPLLANDPHLDLSTPPVFYPVHLTATTSGFDVIGDGFAGAPFIVTGQNRNLAWGVTNNAFDVTDYYQETVRLDPHSGGLVSVYKGSSEPLEVIDEVFRYNILGDGVSDNVGIAPSDDSFNGVFIPRATLVIPRRNQGPIIALDLSKGTALSVQYTGFSATRELDAFRLLCSSRSISDFRRALQYFDVGSQNFLYADTHGTIAYFTSGELPLREDLQAGTVTGLPPYFVRNGTGGNEWIAESLPSEDQATPFAILPFSELPHDVNPERGYLLTANNDPIGVTFDNNPLNQMRASGGIYYLSSRFNFGIRAQMVSDRLGDLLRTRRATPEDMRAIQADTKLHDAEVLTPFIFEAFRNGERRDAPRAMRDLVDDVRVAEAVRRLRAWDLTTPTGIEEGYDAADTGNHMVARRDAANSVAASIYAVWRGQFIRTTILATLARIGLSDHDPPNQQAVSALRYLLDHFADNGGFGASGVNFFDLPGLASATDRRDILILRSLKDALELLASEAFARAYNHSTRQSDYRWGKIHRVVIDHPLGDAFSLTGQRPGNPFAPPLPDLPGLPVDGGYETIDAASHNPRASAPHDFEFSAGPIRRYVVSLTSLPRRVAKSSLPGGTSGVLDSPFFNNMLERWLTNETFDLRQAPRGLLGSISEVVVLRPQ